MTSASIDLKRYRAQASLDIGAAYGDRATDAEETNSGSELLSHLRFLYTLEGACSDIVHNARCRKNLVIAGDGHRSALKIGGKFDAITV